MAIAMDCGNGLWQWAAAMGSGNGSHGNGNDGVQRQQWHVYTTAQKLQPFLPATRTEKELHANCTTMDNGQWQQMAMSQPSWAVLSIVALHDNGDCCEEDSSVENYCRSNVSVKYFFLKLLLVVSVELTIY